MGVTLIYEINTVTGKSTPHVDIVSPWAAMFDEKFSELFGWVGTAEKADSLLQEYEKATGTHFVPQKLSKDLGTSGKLPSASVNK